MMVPLWVAAPALSASAALGWGLDRALRWQLEGAGAWAIRAAVGLGIVVAAIVHPLAAIALGVALAVTGRWIARRDERAEPARGALLILASVAAVVALRPPAPLYWDEHVWLAKVRIGALALRDAALDPAGDVIPRAYPIAGSITEILLAAGRDDVGSGVAGAAVLLLLALALALAVIPPHRRVAWALALALVPLAWVHARSAYLDLPVGLFGVAIAAGLARRSRPSVIAAAIAAFFVAGCKDEGVVHALAIAGAHVALARHRRRDAAREGALVAACALVPAITWRVLLAVHGVHAADHALEGAGLARAGAILGELARATWDVRSWGLAWPLALGALIATRARGIGAAWLAQLSALVLALLAGGDRLAAFALDGSLVNRFWMQLAPLAVLVVVSALDQRGSSTSNTALGIHS